MGQVAPNKGHCLLIKAAEILRQRGIAFEVLVYGSGDLEYATKLKHRLAEAGLSNAWRWMGYERDQQMIYESIDLCVMPSQVEEAFGMVAAEASAYGLPVIASRMGGLREIVEEGVTGFLLDPSDANSFAAKVELLAENPALAKAMGEAGRQRILANFTVEKMVAEFEALFREITTKSK